uniref:Uncharacterized protein n=1 Tax=Aplanochytrium stocchinoi TaxID=215587 RepID=A0A7S3PQS7_9STRA|mmetsp:Transcript_15557/g.19268  ORF Transcript_15557/g.19268 Transcript_15557/m.19268 type:complete len:429 (+) Transcript_15557:190-1476(+)
MDKPDKVDDEEPKTWANGARLYGVLMIMCGAVIIGMSVPYLQRSDQVDNLKSLLEVGAPSFASKLSLPVYSIIGGVLAIFGGILAIVVYYKSEGLGKTKSLIGVIIAAFLSTVGGGIMIYASLEITHTLDNVLARLANDPIRDTSFTSEEKHILDMTSAIYNTCCMTEYDSRDYKGSGEAIFDKSGPGAGCGGSPYTAVTSSGPATVQECIDDHSVWDNQLEIGNCVPGNFTASCDPSNYPDIIGIIANNPALGELTDLLCICISEESNYNKVVSRIQSGGMCNKFRDLIVEKADDRPIPTTNVDFGFITTLLPTIRPDYSNDIPIGKFAMVGKIMPPASHWGEATEEIGWSCGLGYAKGAAYQMYLYIKDTTAILEVAGLGIGAATGALSLIMVAFMFVGGGSSEGDFLDYEDEYPDELGTGKGASL